MISSRLSNFWFQPRHGASSVVHTGVKSFGCENKRDAGNCQPVVKADFTFGHIHLEIRAVSPIANVMAVSDPSSFSALPSLNISVPEGPAIAPSGGRDTAHSSEQQ